MHPYPTATAESDTACRYDHYTDTTTRLYQPIIVSGRLSVGTQSFEIADSGYSLVAAEITTLNLGEDMIPVVLAPMAIDKVKLAEKISSAGKTVTPQRITIFRALELVGEPITAYELRDLTNSWSDESFNISTIYRVLDFWVELGLIHKNRVSKQICSL